MRLPRRLPPARPKPARRGRQRPAGRERSRVPGPVRLKGAPKPSRRKRQPGRLTMRAAVLGLVACALVLSLAYPFKQYLAQRGQISQLEQQNAQARQQVRALERRQRQLSDPAYIKAQARARLQYVMPGETPFVVVHGQKRHHGGRPRESVTVGGKAPWYGQLWSSVRQADRAP